MFAPSTAVLDGLALSGDDSAGAKWVLGDIVGWGSPASTVNPVQKVAGHGSWSGDAYLAPRYLTLSGSVQSQNPRVLSEAMDRLVDAASLDPVLLAVVEDGRARTCMVRRAGEVLAQRTGRYGWAWAVPLVADDPRKYGAEQSGSTALPSTTGGLTGPITGPIISNATVVSGFVTIVNDGKGINAPLLVRFDGPVVGPSVTHVQSGAVWAADTAVLSSGEFWTLAMPTGQVLAQAQAQRAGYVTRRGRFELLPGQNDFLFGAASYSADALMTVTAASAWK